jgi:hypothetical protein
VRTSHHGRTRSYDLDGSPKEGLSFLNLVEAHVLASAMQVAGANVRRVGPDIQKGSTDEEWLEIVGRNNWIALMRDQKIRRRRLETEALKTHGVAAFALKELRFLPHA